MKLFRCLFVQLCCVKSAVVLEKVLWMLEVKR